MQKSQSQRDEGLSELILQHREWQDMQAKGKVRMKKKFSKQGKQYYDFDFSRYQYYYSFPEDHISMASPSIQQSFLNRVLCENSADFTSLYVDSKDGSWRQLEKIMKTYQLHEMLQDMLDELKEKLTGLRIEKSLRIQQICEERGSYSPKQMPQEQSVIELIDAEIRSYLHKTYKVEEVHYTFGERDSAKSQSHPSHLKKRAVDELKSCNLAKSDLIVFARMRRVKHQLNFNINTLKQVILMAHCNQKHQVCGRAKNRLSRRASAKKRLIQQWKQQAMNLIMDGAAKIDPPHFDSTENKATLLQLMNRLDYIVSYQRSIQLASKKEHVSPSQLTDICYNYDEVLYRPKTSQEILERMRIKCRSYFKEELVEQMLGTSDQIICSKINSLCFLQLKALWETYDTSYLVAGNAEERTSNLLKIRSLMSMELNLVFNKDIDKLLNIREHSLKVVTHEVEIPDLLYTYTPLHEHQSIMLEEIIQPNRFRDPLIICFCELLDIKSESTVRTQIEKYVERVLASSSEVLGHQLLYYDSLHVDEKDHIIKIINHSLAIEPDRIFDPKTAFYLGVLSSAYAGASPLRSNLLYSHYQLTYLNCVENKSQLLEMLNGQKMCMIRVQKRLHHLWRMGKLPFNMSKEFITRFTEPNQKGDYEQFDFLQPQKCQQHMQSLFSLHNWGHSFNHEAERDQLVHKRVNKDQKDATLIEVHRMNSHNSLTEGKSVIYQQSFADVKDAMLRVQFLCSETIRKRELLLPDLGITEVVDRFELLHEFIRLETEYQRSKVELLHTYCEMLLHCTSSDGIRQIYEQMCRIRNYNCIVDTTQMHYRHSYETETRLLSSKCKIVQALIAKQLDHEKSMKDADFRKFRNANLNAKIPEISSVYCYLEDCITPIVEKSQEQQFKEEQLATEEPGNDSHLQDGEPTCPPVSGGDGVEAHVSEDDSNYMLKVSFQEILVKKSVTSKQKSLKKEHVTNRRREKLISDSILGCNMPRNNQLIEGFGQNHLNRTPPEIGSGTVQWPKSQLYVSLHMVMAVMESIDACLQSDSTAFANKYSKMVNKEYKCELLERFADIVCSYRFVEFQPLIHPDQIPLVFNSIDNILQSQLKRVNKFLNDTPTSHQLLLAVPPESLQKIASAKSGQELDEFRGLYLGINAIQANQLSYLMQIVEGTYCANCSPGYTIDEKIEELFSLYSYECRERYPLMSSQHFTEGPVTNSQPLKQLFGLYRSFVKTNSLYNLAIGNLLHYYKAITAFKISMLQLLELYGRYLFTKKCQPLLQIQEELKMMEMYQCCTDVSQGVYQIGSIENKVYLKRKIESVEAYKKNCLSGENLQEVSVKLSQYIQQINQGYCLSVNSSDSKNPVEQSAMLQKLVRQLMQIVMAVTNECVQIDSYLGSEMEYEQIRGYMQLLPKAGFALKPEPNPFFGKIFGDHEAMGKPSALLDPHVPSKPQKIIKRRPLQIRTINSDFSELNQQQINRWLTTHVFTRKYHEFSHSDKEAADHRYYRRHCRRSLLLGEKTQLRGMLGKSSLHNAEFVKLLKLRMWIQAKIVMFGCTLGREQLLQLWKMMSNKQLAFPVFWEDSACNLISNRDLARMRNFSVDSLQVVELYKNQYLDYAHLKKTYTNFMSDFADYDHTEELEEVILVLYFGAQQLFHRNEPNWMFLTQFAETQCHRTDSQADQFFEHLNRNNPAKLNGEKDSLISKNGNQTICNLGSSSLYRVSQIRYWAWNQKNQANRGKMKKVDEALRFMKEKFMEVGRLPSGFKLRTEIVHCFYKRERLSLVLSYLGINLADSQAKAYAFRCDFDQAVREGVVVLDSQQTRICNAVAKDQQSQVEFAKIKDDLLQIIISNAYCQKLIREKFYTFSQQIIRDQLRLLTILTEDYRNEQRSRDQEIMSQTVNKILLPKIKMNPFLSSPLRCDNYFFAGSAKLSFIDQFLNKMRNRAVLIELTEGGSGYLLKVGELDEAVDALCKSFIEFSEKEFADRMRTYNENFECLRQKYLDSVKEAKQLKSILLSFKVQERKEVKSIVYQKLNEYLVRFYEHDQLHTHTLDLFRNLEDRVQRELAQKYQQDINTLELDNKRLREELAEFKKDMLSMTCSQIHHTKDKLYSDFKCKAEKVINKRIADPHDPNRTRNPSKCQVKQQAQQSEPDLETVKRSQSQVYLRKLKMQKVWFGLQKHAIQSKYQERIACLSQKIGETAKVQSLLFTEQEKGRQLTQEIKILQQCAIENEGLKEEKKSRLENETIERLRLIKVNQSLKGKVKRAGEQAEAQNLKWRQKIDEVTKREKQSHRSFSVQVSTALKLGGQTSKYKSIRFSSTKTEGDRPADQVIRENQIRQSLWKEKWLQKAQAVHQIIQNLKSITEHLLVTKNVQKAIVHLKGLIMEYQTDKLLEQ